MKELVPLFIAGATPLLVLALLGVGLGFGQVSWQPPVLWTAQFGTPNSSSGVTAIHADTSGVIAAGSGFRNPLNRTATPSYLFVNRFSLSGSQIWSQQLSNSNSSSNAEIRGVSSEIGAVYVIGNANDSSFVNKYDSNGNRIWSVQIGSLNTVLNSISVGGSGVYVSGSGPWSNSSYGGFLRDYDFNGTLVWNIFLGNAYDPGPMTTYVGTDGLFVTGSNDHVSYDSKAFIAKIHFDGSFDWLRQFDDSSFTCTCEPVGISGDGSGVYVAGEVGGPFPGQTWDHRQDTFLRKYDLNGNVVWTAQLAAPDYSQTFPPSMSADASGIYLLMPTNYHLFAMRFDSGGHQSWMFQPANTVPQSVITVGTAGLYLGGSVGARAAISEIGISSSLVFFNLNPPYSFALLISLISISMVCVLWVVRKRPKRRSTRGVTAFSAKIPCDLSRCQSTCSLYH